MARPGERIITNAELENRLAALKSQVDSILSFLVFIDGAEIKNFLIQGEAQVLFAGAGTAITFDQPYKVGTIPIVILSSQNKSCVVGRHAAPTATGFTGYGRGLDDSSFDVYGSWVAIGERG